MEDLKGGGEGQAVARPWGLTIWDVAGMCLAESYLLSDGGGRSVLAVPVDGGGSVCISGFDEAAVGELSDLPDGKGGKVLFSRAGDDLLCAALYSDDAFDALMGACRVCSRRLVLDRGGAQDGREDREHAAARLSTYLNQNGIPLMRFSLASGISSCTIERLLSTDGSMRAATLDRIEKAIDAGAGRLPWAEPTDAEYCKMALAAPKGGFSKFWLAKSFSSEACSTAKPHSVDGFLGRAESAGLLARSKSSGKWKVADREGCEGVAKGRRPVQGQVPQTAEKHEAQGLQDDRREACAVLPK